MKALDIRASLQGSSKGVTMASTRLVGEHREALPGMELEESPD